VLLELVNLDLKVVDDVVSVCECYSMVLHLLLKLFQLLLHTLDLQDLRGLELLKLTGLNLGGLLSRPQKNTTTSLLCNDALSVVLQLKQMLGISGHVRPATVVMNLKDIAHLIHASLPLWVRSVLDRVQ
jgi:hypothetical protein